MKPSSHHICTNNSHLAKLYQVHPNMKLLNVNLIIVICDSKIDCYNNKKYKLQIGTVIYQDLDFVFSHNPSYQFTSQHTILQSFIPAMYEECIIRCWEVADTISLLCLKTDSWTSKNGDSYLAVTVHCTLHN
ncbi:hypothetical protein PR048_031989 [Dryococelus australis]|uniref:Uncharacterized protein n=1 Tax=Dryococelus australis TaxID=614101 RepID=A0ABQ9G6U5_9NEOP|nr:hypothetical protein PR048_031989 [Dryococelus australis]